MAQKLIWLYNQSCHSCGVPVNSWDKKCSRALAYQHINCEKCISREYDVTVEQLRGTMQEHFGLVPCQGL